jgi:hypothetical protein
MKKSIIRIAVAAATVAAAFVNCVQVSDATGGRVDEFLSALDKTPDASPALSGIAAAYTQTAAIYPNTPLNSLKAGLTVTARYVGGATKTVPASDYQLSGALTVGTSAITVIYQGQTAAFNVNVSLPDALLVSISAAYDSTEAVYAGAALDDLKNNLTVTALYGDGTARTLGASEYGLSGTLAYPSGVITVKYENRTASFSVNVKARDASAYLYAKAPPVLPSDTPIDLSLASGTFILNKAFNYVNANPGTYTFVLESDMDIATESYAYTASLTQPDVKLTIVGLGVERKIRMVSSGSMTINLGALGADNAPGLELTLGDNVTVSGGGIVVWAGALKMQGNAKVADGRGVIVRDSGSFVMRNDAAVHGNTSSGFGGGGVSVIWGGAFLMEGNASVYENTAPTGNANDVAGGVYVSGAGSSFTLRGNASVRGNNGRGVYILGGDALDVYYGFKTTFTMQDNASVHDNTNYGVHAQNSGDIIMEDDASIHGNANSGVYVSGGSLTMGDRASVYGNVASNSGGGVYISSNRYTSSSSIKLRGSFAMDGDASIHGNTAGSGGGGVYIGEDGDFAMSGNALIYGNAATNAPGSGGGVYVGYNGNFTMAGGTIYGLNAPSDAFKNTAGQSGAALFVAGSAGTVEYGDGTAITGKGNGADITITGK